jgi:DNA-binding transcriptional ArsR family regulator
MRARVEGFPELYNDMACFAHALSHPARIAIMSMLLEHGETCCGDIVRQMPLSQPSVSQHLRELVKAGILQTRNEGQKVFYSLVRDKIRCFCTVFKETIESPAGITIF